MSIRRDTFTFLITYSRVDVITSTTHNYSGRLYLFTVLMIILPGGIGFKFGTDFQIWVILSLIFLFPSFLVIMMGKKIKLDKIDIIMLTLVVLSSFFTYFEKDSFKAMLGTIMRNFMTIYMPYFAGRYFIKRETGLLWLLHVLSITAAVVFLMALYEYGSGQSFFQNLSPALYLYPEDDWRNSVMVFERFGQIRVAASFAQPLYLGTYFGMVVMINMILLFEGERVHLKLGKVLVPLIILAASVGVLITQARTVMLAIVIGMVFFIINKRKSIKWRILLIAIVLPVAVFFLILILFSDYFSDFIYYNVTAENASVNWTYRMELASLSLNHIFSYFNWIGEALSEKSASRWFYENNDLLQGFLNPFLRNGIIFALLYLYIWFFTIIYLAKRRRVNWWSSLCLFVMIYLFVVNNITALNMQNEIIFYIFLGLSMNHALANIDGMDTGL